MSKNRMFKKEMKIDLEKQAKGHYVPDGFFDSYKCNRGRIPKKEVK